MHLEKLSKEEILQTEIPTGKPKEYIFDDNLNVTETKYL